MKCPMRNRMRHGIVMMVMPNNSMKKSIMELIEEILILNETLKATLNNN